MPPRRSNKKSPRGKAEKTGQSSGQKQDESKPAAERLGSLGQFLEASVSSPKVTPNDQAGPGASLPGPATSTQDAAAIPVDESGRPVKLSKKQKQRQKKRLQQRMAAAEGQTSRIGESEIDAIVVDSDAGVEDSAMTGADEDGATAAETVEDSKKKGKQPMQAGRETKGPGEPKGPVSSVEVQYLQRKYEEEASTLSGGGPSPSTPLGAGLAGGPTHAPRENSPKAPESLELPMAPGGASTQLEAKSKGKGRKGRDLTAPRLASIKAASSTDAAHSAPSSGPESPLEGAGKSKGTSSAAARARSAARAMRESMKRQEEEEKKKKKESALSLRIDSLRAEGLTEPDEDEFFKTALRVEKMTKETAPAPFRADADPSLPTFGLVDWDGMFNELLGLTGPSSPPHQACVQSGLGNVADPATTSLDDLDAAFEEMEGGPAVCEPADAQDEAEAIMTSPLTSLSRVSTPVSLVEDSPSAPLSATPTIIAPETPPPAMSTHRRQMEQAFQQNMHRTRNVTRSERAAASEQNDADGLSVRSSLSTCSVMRKVSGSRAEGTGSGASTPQSARSTQSNASGSGRRSAAGSGANTSYTPRFHDIRESFGEGEGEGAGDDDVDLV
ncbi:hypothetical protein Dda_2484 [Drechslerella dactyloides]|uniref:Uncharacterized protein n=1 Tax=Drechslerella dactyloides TaxID=74499 RepID=A0AAD6NJD3_DREDA|nr:hypothetical protein Dda_2484 [Drechslerella dactyloides]